MAQPFPEDLAGHLLDLVRESDRERYLCLLLMPDARRAELSALYAFNAELAQMRERISDPAAGEVRLAWWEQVIEGIYTGEVDQRAGVARPGPRRRGGRHRAPHACST
jgi:phytoene synthase